jgi:phosphoglycolate phosphatase
MEDQTAAPHSMSGMKARWIFFDLDGTLADSLPGLEASIAEALASGGRRLRVESLRPYIGPGIRTILRNLESDLTEADLDGMERYFRASYDTNGVRNTRMFDGVRETLEALKTGGAELFLVTNKPKLATANLIEQHGMTGMFTEMLSGNSREPAYASKGEMLCELIARNGVDAAQAVMVGDTAEDYHAASEAAISFAFVEYGYGEIGVEVECMRVARFADLLNACGHSTGV